MRWADLRYNNNNNTTVYEQREGYLEAVSTVLYKSDYMKNYTP